MNITRWTQLVKLYPASKELWLLNGPLLFARPRMGLFVEPEGEPAGDGFFIAGLAMVSVPNIEGDGDRPAGLKLDIVVSPF